VFICMDLKSGPARSAARPMMLSNPSLDQEVVEIAD
jgi:hypothetical protein